MENELEKTANVENTETKTPNTAELDKRIKQLEAENEKLKQSVTNASADASKYKKQLQERMTEEEKANAEREAASAAMQQELELLRKERNVANHKAQLTAIGFDETLAQATAEAINEGDTVKLFDGIRKFIESHDKELRAKSLIGNPVISGGKADKTMSKEEFEKMGYTDRVKLFNENPELYKEMTKTS